MAKRKKSAASAVADLVSDEAPKRKKPAKGPETTSRSGLCGYCGKKKKVAWTETDENWELPGHPDRVDRDVCVDCSSEAWSRSNCISEVLKTLKTQLQKKKVAAHEVSQAVKVASKAFFVDLDDKSLVAMAKKLKVKHPWLTGRKAK